MMINIENENEYKLDAFKMLNENSTNVDFDVIEARYIHSVRTANLCYKIASDISDSNNELKTNAYLAGLYHDICKLSSSNHGMDAVRKIDSSNCLIKYNSKVKNAIMIHSAKYIGMLDNNYIGNILRDADIIDKFSYDSICKSISGAKNIIKRLEILYTKREVLKKYKCFTVASQKYFDEGMKTLNTFIENLETCVIE